MDGEGHVDQPLILSSFFQAEGSIVCLRPEMTVGKGMAGARRLATHHLRLLILFSSSFLLETKASFFA
jgi:hypothetical protein